ncbi:hypothetical protein [Evtepia sp.]|uniref:hypothetical protein n=1 Tax=Evtepia sp. TaxID=2773933 RepID=UPI002A8052F9|nr:hypothetical protein [Evtepia sp.]
MEAFLKSFEELPDTLTESKVENRHAVPQNHAILSAFLMCSTTWKSACGKKKDPLISSLDSHSGQILNSTPFSVPTDSTLHPSRFVVQS